MSTVVKEKRRPLRFIKSNGSNAGEFDSPAALKLKEVAKSNKEAFLALLESDENGLTSAQAKERRSKVGINEVEHEKAPSWYIQLFEAFVNPFIGVLLVLAIVSLITDVVMNAPADRDYTTVAVISTMVILSAMLRFVQEFRSNQAAEKLKQMVTTTATVVRAEGKKEVDIKKLVPGDIIQLSAGDMIPADVRIMQSKDLFVSQAMLTGEALPVEKTEAANKKADKISPLDLDNVCFMGTNVVSGTAHAVVVNTGSETYFGSLSKSLVGKR